MGRSLGGKVGGTGLSARPLTQHPDEVLTASYLDGGLEGAERDRFEAHLAECRTCRAGVALLRSRLAGVNLQVPKEFLARGKKVTVRRKLLQIPSLLGMAASLLLVAGALTWVARRSTSHPTTPPPFRGGQSDRFSSLSPAAGISVPATAILFRWSAVEGADRYELGVFDSGGRKILEFTAGASARSVSWPSQRPLPPPGSYLWEIRALALDRALAESDLIPFEVIP